MGHTARGSPSVPVLVRQSALEVMPAISSIFILVYCTLSLVTVVVRVDCRPSWRRLNISLSEFLLDPFVFEREREMMQRHSRILSLSGYLGNQREPWQLLHVAH